MGYFDGLTDAAFKKDASGNTLFYPWGIFGSGFVVPSEAARDGIRKFYKRMYLIMLVGIVAGQVAVGWWLAAAFLPFFCIWYCFVVRKLTRGLSKTTEKLRISESYRSSARSHNLATLILLELLSVGFVVLSIWLLQAGEGQLMIYAGIVFFGLCSLAIGYMIFAKLRRE